MIVEGPLPTERPEVQGALPADLLELTHACRCKDAHHRPDAAAVTRAPFFSRHLSNPVDLRGMLCSLRPMLEAEASQPPQ